MINIIACVQGDMGIGYKGDLIWKLPEDRAKFRELTMGHPVLMGRKTWESLPAPLKGRENMVLTHKLYRGCTLCPSLKAVLSLHEVDSPTEDIWVIGGAKVYEQLLPYAKRMYLTRVLSIESADTFFPEIDWANWSIAYSEPLCTKPVSAFLEVWYRNGL